MDGLYAKSARGKCFTALMELVTADDNILLAYRNISKNKGSKTAGTDGKTIRDLSKFTSTALIHYVKRRLEKYQPQPVRRVEIPKGDTGKTRPLGIPTIADRLIQQCFLQILEPICEAKFHERSNGFRPNRSAEHALAQCYAMIQKRELHSHPNSCHWQKGDYKSCAVTTAKRKTAGETEHPAQNSRFIPNLKAIIH